MKKILFVSLCVATLMSCGQKQGPSEQEIQERIDAAVKAAVEEKAATDETSTPTSSYTSDTESTESADNNSVKPSKKESPQASLVGEFKFSDDVSEWIVTFNSDESCQFSSNGNTYYGSWRQSLGCEYYHCNMSDEIFLVINGKREYFIPTIDLDCQWLYKTYSALKAKNPNQRVRLSRIK